MTTFFQQLKLLLWKNWILRKRHWSRVFMEFVWPLILFLILMWVRTRGLKQHRHSCHLVEKALPSVGGFEFFQNFFCTLNNTCYKDYVENEGNQLWEKSVFLQLVNDMYPLLDEIVSDENSLRTVGLLWNETMDLMNIANAWVAYDEETRNRTLGTAKLGELMGKYGKKAFIEYTSTYTKLTATDATRLLEAEIQFDNVNLFTLNELRESFSSPDKCDNVSVGHIIRLTDDTLLQSICHLDKSEKGVLFYFLTRLVDKNGLVHFLKGKEEWRLSVRNKTSKAMTDLLDFNSFQTFEKLQTMSTHLMKFGQHFRKFAKLNGTDLAAAFMYEGLCGVEPKGNQSLFTFDPGAANRFDSLRDRLKDWRTDHHYEVDEDISMACNGMFQRLESMPFTSLLWRMVKPFLRGVIYYSPKTPFTDDIMKRVEMKFGALREAQKGINSVTKLLDRTRVWFKTNMEDLTQTFKILESDTNFAGFASLFGFQPTADERAYAINVLKQVVAMDVEKTLGSVDFAVEILDELVGCVKYNKTRGFATEWQAVNAGSVLLSAEKLWAVIVFENVANNASEVDPRHVRYKIRMDSDKVDGTRASRDRLTSKGGRRRPIFDLKYITNGFVYIQEMIEHSLIESATGKTMDTFSTYLQQFPYPCHIYDQFIRAISRTYPLLMVLSWVYASSMIVKSLVMEKELRLKEIMKVMGMSNGVIWTGWFIDSFIIMFISGTMLSLILKYGRVIENSDITLIWVFMISYMVATINFSFLISTMFTRANSAAAAGGILFFVSYLPYNMLLIWEEQLTWFHILCSCLLSNVAFGFGCTYFARLEEDGIGGQWNRITLKTLPEDDFNLSYCILMLWVDSVLYFILTWYLEAVLPGATGVPKPWNFFLKKSYWTGQTDVQPRVAYEAVPQTPAPSVIAVELDGPVMEADPDGLKPGVSVLHLTKKFSNGKVAVEDLSINFYENQITSFLGHNGAGKTTTISMLTGLFPPTSGTAKIYGLDICKDMDIIRHSCGICPQYNTLFDRLNVEEHLQFYAGLKGKWDENFEKEMMKMITDLGIPHKRHEFPKNLSGGMKRKLSVACSFIGGSKTVFLDEPTSGVDPYSRRSIWELLLKYKEGRTIIMTTHFMDEADILGDRIAIISQGKLKACGSSVFLKSHFGQGYSLRLVREDTFISASSPAPAPSANNNSENPGTNTKTALVDNANQIPRPALAQNFVKRIIREAILVDDVGSDVLFLLPYATIREFPTLFQKLDENTKEIGISSYGISDTTLEDVFLKITIDDVEHISESFQALDGKCKRRVMEMCRRFRRGQAIRRRTMPLLAVTPNPTPALTIIATPDIIEASQSHTQNNGLLTFTPAVTNIAETGEGPDGNLNLLLTPTTPVTTISAHETGSNGNLNLLPLPLACDGGSIGSSNDSTNNSLLGEFCTEDDFPVRTNETKLSCWTALTIQIWMIYLKRLLNSSRNWKAMFFEIVLPAVFIAVTLAFTLILPPATDEPPREITPWTYPSPNVVFFSDQYDAASSVPEFSSFVDGLLGPVGMGTPCLNDELSRGICTPSLWSNKTVTEFREKTKKYPRTKLDACSCASGSLQCPGSVSAVRPPKLTLPTKDFLYDVSHLNIPEWIEKTYRNYEASRYGGFEFEVRNQRAPTVTAFLGLLDHFTQFVPKTSLLPDENQTALDMDSQQHPLKYKIWYENRGWVSSVSYLNAMHNIMLRENLPEHLEGHKSEFGITLTTHPMNLTKSQSNKENLKTAGLGVIHAICIIFALSFVPASFTVYLIEERKNGGKHLHLLSGVKPITYWVSNFLYDLTKYLVPVILSVLLFLAFDAKAYVGKPSILSFICLLLLYGWASIPAMYPFSFCFSVPSTAFVVLACMNLFIGVVSTVSTFVLEQFGDEELERVGKILKKVFLIFPHYCLGRGLIELVALDMESVVSDKLGMSPEHEKDRFEWEHLGKMLFFLGIHGFVFYSFTIICEYRQVWYFLLCKICQRKKRLAQLKTEDEDVLKERSRVLDHPDLVCSVRVENLTKFYSGRRHAAVNNLTFAIEKGECFGLLGVNGAGKTSSFKMLTGDVRISSGRAKICGEDVEINLDAARKHIGYCPQEDGLDPLLNAFEMLRLYGRLRGMTSAEIRCAVPKLVRTLGLSAFALRQCGTYSGGNRRKLSTAIALIGDPDVVFLDEPTSGMDPVSRRKFWKVILRLVRIGKSVVLTSHSMEECEALCSRIAIMVNGEFKCLGSLQHIKNRFGDGYTVVIRSPKENHETLLVRLRGSLPSARLEDSHCSQLNFAIPQADCKLSEIFNVMFSMKEDGLIDDYSVSQTTLDDIFVKFASHQKDDMDR